MNEQIQKIQACMNTLAGIQPRVDQIDTITRPLIAVLNTLADVRDTLSKQEENSDTPESAGE